MQVVKEVVNIKTSQRVEIVDITPDIEKIVQGCAVTKGLVNVFSRHSTSAIIINENEQRLLRDIKNSLETLIPQNEDYAHNIIDNNADSHLRGVLMGGSQCIPLDKGKLELGTWQSIFFVELDGPRNRKVNLTVIGD